MFGGFSGITARFGATPAPFKGALCMVGATLAMSLMSADIRHLSATVHPFEITFFRNLFGLAAFAPLFLRTGFKPLRTRHPGLHALRAVLNTAGMLLFFTALGLVPLALVAALAFTSPLFATLYAIVVLGERVRVRRWTALIAGFAGALVIVRPGIAEIDAGALLVVLSSAIWAGALMVIKVLSRTDSPVTITALAALLMTPLSAIPAALVWQWPSPAELGWLAAVGILGSLGQVAVAQAFRFAEVGAVLPFDFLKLIWAALLGLVLFAEVPDGWTLVGGAIIFAAATYIAYRETGLRAA